jgi:beta-lactam-binding protein with PASTA domain
LLAIGGLAFFLTLNKAVTQMPDVTGQQVAAATIQLRGDGLAIGLIKSVSSPLPQGTVVSTDPKAGAKIKKGEIVTLKVSKGKVTVAVKIPSVVGKNQIDAENILTQAKLLYKVNLTTTASPGVIPNTVISQSPVAGVTGQTQDTVIITVLAPGTKFQLPDLSSDTPLQAASRLYQVGLSVSATTSSLCSNSVPSGLVVVTIPGAGSLVQAGSSVQLVTSSGFCKVVVPNVVGRGQDGATAALKGQGLQAAYSVADPAFCTPSQIGTVVAQSVAPGSNALYNSTVDLSICNDSTTSTTTVG